jgi:hypothetical protein
MEPAGGDGGRVRRRRTLRSTRFDEDGVGIIEILMAFAVFMVCFLPLLMFLPTGAKVIVNSTNQRTATAIANTMLANAQNSTTPPDWTSSPPQVPPTWPGVVGAASTQDGVPFQIYTLSGWCAFNPTTGVWDTTWRTGDHASYHEVVKVGWGPRVSSTSTTNVVVDSTELGTTPIAAPQVGDTTSCPLGVT